MPIIFEKKEGDSLISVFKMEESNDFFTRSIDFTEMDFLEFNSIKHPEKQRQWLASRYLLKKMSKENRTLYVKKSELGKPHFTNHHAHFSISHSRDYVAMIYSLDKKVAIDIEKLQPKIERIKRKFLHSSDYEQGEHLINLTLIWSAKEAIYKFFHTKELYSFKENISIVEREDSILKAEVHFRSSIVHLTLNYLLIEDFIMVYFQE